MSQLELKPGERLVEFIQYDIPPLKSGEYTVSVTQTVNQPPPHDKFETSRKFAVVGERFSIDPAEIESVFPPPLAAGEFMDTLPHVVFSRRTLPWERTSVATDISAPWLAILLFDEEDAPEPTQRTAADLFPEGEAIEVEGTKGAAGKGALPAGYVSNPGMNPLDYGESPKDECTTIDVPREVFDAIAPSSADLPFLAHIREADTVDAHDHPEVTATTAILLGNRTGLPNKASSAFLVSLENMGPLLPGEDGTPSKASDAKFVRLITYRYWAFTANRGGETLQGLLENLNQKPPEAEKALSTLQVPFKGERPQAKQVEEALKAQEAGKLSPAQSQVLVHDALGMGYVPMPHHLRHGGETVSWYRGPLAPFEVDASVKTPISCPDAANRYNPQTGMFDVSYGAAWQLGQLLALQNNAYAVALYQWRRELKVEEATQVEQERIIEMLGGAFESVLGHRERLLASSKSEMPELVVKWLGQLRLLYGVPFNYLVPNEAMLPPESLRFFHLDRAWMEALLDGALSIGRITSGERELDARRVTGVHDLAFTAGRQLRGNAVPASNHVNAENEVTGFLLRSQAVAGWPKLNAKGYADAKGKIEVKKLRLTRLSEDVMLCLFDGVVELAALREPPEQLHCGYEGAPGNLTTTLREVQGETPGRQYTEDPKGGKPVAVVQARTDGRTIEAAATASNIKNKLNTDFEQGLSKFTAAEFALEMVKGVVEVDFRRS